MGVETALIIIIIIGSGLLIGLYLDIRRQTHEWQTLTPEWEAARQKVFQSANKIIRELAVEAGRLKPRYGGPYARLYAEADAQAARAETGLAVVRADRQRPTATDTALIAGLAAWPIVGVLIRYVRLWQWQRMTLQMANLLAEAEADLQAVVRLNQQISRVGYETKIRAIEVRAKIDGLRHRIAAEQRAHLQLTEEKSKLDQAATALDESDKLLATADPPKPQVVEAHPRLEEAALWTAQVAERVADCESRRTGAEQALKSIHSRLAEFEKALVLGEKQQAPMPGLKKQAADLKALADKQAAPLQSGEYGKVNEAVTSILETLAELETQLDGLQTARERATQQLAEAEQLLAQIRQWVDQQPRPFEMDRTQTFISRLEEYIGALRQGLAGEAAETLHALSTFDRKPLQDAQREFTQAKEKYTDLSQTMREAKIAERLTQVEQLLADLEKRHEKYQQQADLIGLTESLRRVQSGWDVLSQTKTVKESKLQDMVRWMAELNSRAASLQRAQKQAEGVIDQCHSQQSKAESELDPVIFTPLLDDCKRLSEDSEAEIKQKAETYQAQYQHSYDQVQRADSNYAQLTQNAQQLRVSITKLVREDAARLATLQTNIESVLKTFNTLLRDFQDFRQRSLGYNLDHQLDPLIASLTGQLADYERVPKASLREMKNYYERSTHLRDDLEPWQDSMRQWLNSLQQATDQVQEGLLQAENTLRNAEQIINRTGWHNLYTRRLQTAHDFLNRARARLQESRRKVTIETAVEEATLTAKLVEEARRQAEEVGNEAAQEMRDIETLRKNLDAKISQTDQAVRRYPERTGEWQRLKQEVTQQSLTIPIANGPERVQQRLIELIARIDDFVNSLSST